MRHTAWVSATEWHPANGARLARQWLAACGVVQGDDGLWHGLGTDAATGVTVGRVWTATELAHDPPEQPDHLAVLDDLDSLRLSLGLLDLLDDYAEAMYIRLNFLDKPELWGTVWQAYRYRLEAPEPADVVEYSLWVDWFEDRTTVETAFEAVLAGDVRDAEERGRIGDFASGGWRRRAQRVLIRSGPVPWRLKHPVYTALAEVPELRHALFRGVLHSYHDYFGDLEPAAGLDLLTHLGLPPDTEHLAPLLTVLRAGHTGHHRQGSEHAWDEAVPSSSMT